MEDPCAVCGGARNDEFLPCCGVSVCSGCSLAAVRPVPCGKCGKTIPQMPTDILDAYARPPPATRARRSGLTLATMLKVPEATRRASRKRRRQRAMPGVRADGERGRRVRGASAEGRAPRGPRENKPRLDGVKWSRSGRGRGGGRARAEAAARDRPRCPRRRCGRAGGGASSCWKEAASADTCEVCGRVAKVQVCTACKCVAYCSRPCQKQDWPRHKNMARPSGDAEDQDAVRRPRARQGAAQCCLLRGALKLRTKNYAKAVEAYERGLALDPTDVVATMNLGIALRNLGQRTPQLGRRLKPYLVKAHELDRDYGPACHNLAEYFYEIEEDAARARPLYQRATSSCRRIRRPGSVSVVPRVHSTTRTARSSRTSGSWSSCRPIRSAGKTYAWATCISLCRAVDFKEPDEFRRYRAAFERHLAEGLRRDPQNADFPKLRIVFDNVLKNYRPARAAASMRRSATIARYAPAAAESRAPACVFAIDGGATRLCNPKYY